MSNSLPPEYYCLEKEGDKPTIPSVWKEVYKMWGTYVRSLWDAGKSISCFQTEQHNRDVRV